MKAIQSAATDKELADMLRPALHELFERLVVRGEASQAAGVTRLLVYVSSDFGVDKQLAAPVDTKTRPMFVDGGGITQ